MKLKLVARWSPDDKGASMKEPPTRPACEVVERDDAGLDLRIGAGVHCQDERCGNLWKVVVDPYTNRVTDLVIAWGAWHQHSYVVPRAAIRQATKEGIELAIDHKDLSRFAEYREREFVEVAGFDLQETQGYSRDEVVERVSPFGMVYPRPIYPMIWHEVHQGIPIDKTVIERGTPVWNAEDTIGNIDHVLADAEQGEITHLVVDTGFFGQAVVIPISAVRAVNENGIEVNIDEQELQELPHYTRRSQADILAELRNRLRKASISPTDCIIEIDQGVVRLSGLVPDEATKHQVEDIARSVAGVISVENVLDTDQDV